MEIKGDFLVKNKKNKKENDLPLSVIALFIIGILIVVIGEVTVTFTRLSGAALIAVAGFIFASKIR